MRGLFLVLESNCINNLRGSCLCSSSYDHNTLKTLRTSARKLPACIKNKEVPSCDFVMTPSCTDVLRVVSVCQVLKYRTPASTITQSFSITQCILLWSHSKTTMTISYLWSSFATGWAIGKDSQWRTCQHSHLHQCHENIRSIESVWLANSPLVWVRVWRCSLQS